MATAVVAGGEVTPPDLGLAVGGLSGGNRQRLMVARELGPGARVVVAAEPGRGLDIRGLDRLARRLRALRDEGCAILLISFDLEGMVRLADTLAVCYRGRVVASRPTAEYAEGEISCLMTGAA